MQNPLFSHVVDDIYVRQYTLSPAQFSGRKVIIYAECALNAEKINGHAYKLDIFCSIDDYPARDFLVGVTFGETKLDKASMDLQIDGWVAHVIEGEDFSRDIKDYLKKEELFEGWIEEKLGELHDE